MPERHAEPKPRKSRRRRSSESSTPQAGSLVVIGTGIKTVGQLTTEALAWMHEADALLYVVGDPIAEAAMQRINPDAVSMAGYYEEGQSRLNAYNAMVEHILSSVRSGKKTVAAFYGHPGVFAYPSHESIRRARAEGFSAFMLPAVSSEDCLFADLGVDPAVGGCQSYEATDFLLNDILIDPSSQLVLWQIGTLGDWTYKTQQYDTQAMPLLRRKLLRTYPASHVAIMYEAPMFPTSKPMIQQVPLQWLADFPVTAAMTLYIPAAFARRSDPEIAYLFTAQAAYPADGRGEPERTEADARA
jgi:tetrapyrrole (corrin/porphyrin) methylase-like protein